MLDMPDDKLPQDKFGFIEFPLKYPFSNPESKFGPVLYGLLVSFLSFLIIPAFTLLGYTFRIRENAATGKPSAPPFTDFVEMTKEGFFGALSYLPLFGIMLVSFILFSALELEVLAFIPYVLTLYFIPAVGVFHAVERTVFDFYKSEEFLDFIKSKGYFFATLKYIAFMLVVAVAVMVGSLVTLGLIVLVAQPLLLYARPCFWGHRYYQIVYSSDKQDEQMATADF